MTRAIVDVYITTWATPSGGFYAYVRDAATHEIAWRTGLSVDAPTAHERARVFISANAYRWRRVSTPDDVPALFPDVPAQSAHPEPAELAMAASELHARAAALRANHSVGRYDPPAERDARHADAAILDHVAAWLDRMAAA